MHKVTPTVSVPAWVPWQAYETRDLLKVSCECRTPIMDKNQALAKERLEIAALKEVVPSEKL